MFQIHLAYRYIELSKK